MKVPHCLSDKDVIIVGSVDLEKVIPVWLGKANPE